MFRFVILRHELPATAARRSHWDLMFERGDVLRTWALGEEPRAGVEMVAEQLPDHRRAYLEYEGPVSGDRGDVQRWDTGTWRELSETTDEWVLWLEGQRLRGRMRLQRDRNEPQRWTVWLSSEG